MSDSIDVSIIIPAFNEEKRLPNFLRQVIAYCRSQPFASELIVVDDGSRDRTAVVAQDFAGDFPQLSVISLYRNRGKGYAVKRGLFKAQGAIVLFLDADGSVGPEEIGRNLSVVRRDGYDIFIGSRVLTDAEQVLQVKWYRKLLGLIFNACVHAFLFPEIRDTQCGFKMFRREVIRPLFGRSYLRGFGFDIELLYLAHKMGYRVKEGPVSWHHVGGSKVNLLVDSLRMFVNILQVRNWHCTPIRPGSPLMGPDEYRYMYELETVHWWFVSRRRIVSRLLASLGGSSSTMLDVGTGTGCNLLAFQQFGHAQGIDASAQAVEFCRKRGLQNVRQCPVERIDAPDGSCDVVTCLDVLEHLANPQQGLREFRRILKPDGRLIVTVPAFQFLWSQHDEALGHYRRYEPASLRAELEEGGFAIERMGYVFFTSFFAVAPIRLLRRLRNPTGPRHSDTTTLPPRWLNRVLIGIGALEEWCALRFGLPLGTSLYAIATPHLRS